MRDSFVTPSTSLVVSGQPVVFQVGLHNTGADVSVVNVTVYLNGKTIASANGLTVSSMYSSYFTIIWPTLGFPLGNYTVSATAFLADDPTPSDNSMADGILEILPPPTITVTPTSGQVGTMVTVHGSAFFFQQYYSVQVEMTFDNQLIGLTFIQQSSFNFTFNVPEAQQGLHQVHAVELFGTIPLDVHANFTVLAPQSSLNLSITTGTIYFPGDTATIVATTSLNGQYSTITVLQLILVTPSGSNITLQTTLATGGVYQSTYKIPTTALIGTYIVIAKAHQTGSNDASALTSFEVKLSWLNSQGRNIITGVAITGLAGVGVLVWRQGYFRRKDEDSIP